MQWGALMLGRSCIGVSPHQPTRRTQSRGSASTGHGRHWRKHAPVNSCCQAVEERVQCPGVGSPVGVREPAAERGTVAPSCASWPDAMNGPSEAREDRQDDGSQAEEAEEGSS